MNKAILVLIGCILLSACGDKVYEVEYYQSHIDEAKAMVEKCVSGDANGQNCANAKTAISKNNAKSFMDKYGNK